MRNSHSLQGLIEGAFLQRLYVYDDIRQFGHFTGMWMKLYLYQNYNRIFLSSRRFRRCLHPPNSFTQFQSSLEIF